jgi:hypothetical protein
MKISLALGPRLPLSRQTAWGCLTTNLALPGFGSLIAGRVSGYPQAALGIGGLVLTMVFGVRFVWWYLANWSRLMGSSSDPVDVLSQLWGAVRWAVAGMAVFAVGALWALATSASIVREAKRAEAAKAPPQLR